MADTSVVASVLTWLEGIAAEEGTGAMLEDYPPGGGLMLSSITGDPYITRYKGGGYVAGYPFSVSLRAPGVDTAGRVAAMELLSDIADSIADRSTWPVEPEGVTYQSFEVRTLPARVGRDDSGADDYQVTFTLTYRKT